MLTGKVFEAQEVIPALVDEIGDMNRAIECVFELANQTLTAARLVTAEPKNEPEEKPAGEEPEELAKLNEQQKAAMTAEASKGGLVMAEDGHVTKEVEGFFGPHTEEIAKPQNKEDMTEQEKKAQEAAAAQAAEKKEEAAKTEDAPKAEAPKAEADKKEEPSKVEEAPKAEEKKPEEAQKPAQRPAAPDEVPIEKKTAKVLSASETYDEFKEFLEEE